MGKEGFPYIEVELDHIPDGTPIYSYGYPLPQTYEPVSLQGGALMVGGGGVGPRTTSAIVSSSVEMTGMVTTDRDPKVYVLDKALNYGNSGGPILISGTGKVFAVCVRFQPVWVPQAGGVPIVVPSLYGIGSSLANIADFLGALPR